jgi:hypothetical protein
MYQGTVPVLLNANLLVYTDKAVDDEFDPIILQSELFIVLRQLPAGFEVQETARQVIPYSFSTIFCTYANQ